MFFQSMDPSWQQLLASSKDPLEQIELQVANLKNLTPGPDQVMRAFELPVEKVRVLVLGQDPYPTPGDAVGFSFSVAPERQNLPRSLKNIYAELHSDLGCEVPASGDLSPWVQQGVLLLNRVLTVRAGEAGSHRGIGWEKVTQEALRALNNRVNTPLVSVLWGNDAIMAKQLLPYAIVIESAHPSPLSASRGFLGSKPFSKANTALIELGQAPINWVLPAQSALF